jgi:hypothetical protein
MLKTALWRLHEKSLQSASNASEPAKGRHKKSGPKAAFL